MEELKKLIIDAIDETCWEEVEFSDYELKEVEELDEVNNGKYSYGGVIIAVYKKGNTDEEPLFYLRQNYTKTGSYYTDYEYHYYKPYVTSKVTKTIEVWE